MELTVKLAIISLCMALKLIGELWWHNAQRYIMPIIITAGIFYITHSWWSFTSLSMIGALVMGYKTYGSKDSVARALWLFVICVVAWLGQVITGHLTWFIYVPYIIGAGWAGTLTRNINNLIGAPINGFWIGLPILFIH